MEKYLFGDRLKKLSVHNPNYKYGKWQELNEDYLRTVSKSFDLLDFFESFERLVETGLVEISKDGSHFRVAMGEKICS